LNSEEDLAFLRLVKGTLIAESLNEKQMGLKVFDPCFDNYVHKNRQQLIDCYCQFGRTDVQAIPEIFDCLLDLQTNLQDNLYFLEWRLDLGDLSKNLDALLVGWQL